MKNLMWYYYTLLLLLLQSHEMISSSSLTHHLCHPDEGLALLQFKQMFHTSIDASADCDYLGQYSYPKMISWNQTTDCCTWDGVTCHRITGPVIGIDLSCSQLGGAISANSSLFHLSHLQKLNLAYNDFKSSEISRRVSGWTSLTNLNLSNSNFYGGIPSEICHLSKLVSLDLSQNAIEFEHQDFQLLLQNLTQVRELSLSNVSIFSEFPKNFSSSLTIVDLSETQVSGKLPDHIFHLSELQKLLLGGTHLSGSLPKFNCSAASMLWDLDLTHTNFSGELPDSFGCLKSLQVLLLDGCQFTGRLPESIGNFSQLKTMSLAHNSFNGPLPSLISNLVELEVLDLTNNQIQGQIPDSFTNLQKLIQLSLPNNHLVGPFPSTIVNLTSLETLDLQSNSITGSLPSKASGLQELSFLYLSNNLLNGTIPPWLFSLQSLTFLLIKNNQLTGQLPQMEEFRGSSLVKIDLSNNQLHGQIPKSFSTLPILNFLELSSNNLSGIAELSSNTLDYLVLSHNRISWSNNENDSIHLPNLHRLELSSCEIKAFPKFFRNLKNLRVLDLSNNKIQGQIPSWLIPMPWDSLVSLNLSYNSLSRMDPLPWKNLKVLDLRSNQIRGPLPYFICILKVLTILDLSRNKFSGAIPQCFGNFSSQLVVMNLAKNGLRRSITMTFARDSRLRYLGLNGNFLEGPLPKTLANCKYLEIIDLGNNNINDTFPTWVENLTELEVLILRSNRFFGPINIFKAKSPFQKLRIFDLSSNEFNGVLPTELFESFQAMMKLQLNESESRYMHTGGNITNYLYTVMITVKGNEVEFNKILKALTTIDLSSNRFHGNIPGVIGNLYSLKTLNLSNNNFLGHIPSAIGNLRLLETLDLSRNQIGGEIPGQLTNLTFLEVLNLSDNHLVGRIPQGNHFDTFPSSSYSGNSGLCGFPLTKLCDQINVSQAPPQVVLEKEEDSDFMSGFTKRSVLIGYGCGFVLGIAIGYLMFLTGKPKGLVRIIEEEVYTNSQLLFGKRKKKKP